MIAAAATMTAPNAGGAATADGATPEARSASASDFLVLMGAEKAAGKKNAKTGKAVPITAAGAAVKTTPHGATGEAKGETTAAATETAKAKIKTIDGKTADVKAAEGEAAKAAMNLPTVIAAALANGASKPTASAAETLIAAANAAAAPEETATPVEGGKKAKPAPRTAQRREGGETASLKTETGQRTPDASEAAKTAKAETVTPAAMAKTAETPAPVLTLTTTPGADPQNAGPLTADVQTSEARIPLATREAAQAGFAAPILSMRVTTKDGVAKAIEIRLDPAELGQVDVKLETGRDGKLRAVLSAENADAFELLKKDSGALEAALRDAGIDLEEGAITFALNDPGTDQSHQREAAYGGAAARRDAAAEEIAAAAAAQHTSWRNGVIDIQV